MSVRFFTAQDNGNLKYVEEVEGTDDVNEAREALFEARPRLANTEEFVVIVGDNEDGTVEVLRKTEVVQESWASSRHREGDEEVAPAPKAKRKPGPKPKAAESAPAKKSTARKPAAKKATGKAKSKPATKAKSKPAAGKKKPSPFTRNAASDE